MRHRAPRPLPAQPTRSFGLLEGFLAAKQANMADSLIDDHLRAGRLLDLGCGAAPHFMRRTRFAEKVGIDPAVRLDWGEAGVKLLRANIEAPPLPFPDAYFSATKGQRLRRDAQAGRVSNRGVQ